MGKLFRQEAMAWRGGAWLGVVQLRTKVSLTYYACICGGMVLGLALLLTIGTYSRKAQFDGVVIVDSDFREKARTPERLLAKFVVPTNSAIALGPRTSIKLTFMGLSVRDSTPLVGRVLSVTPVVDDGSKSRGDHCVILVQLSQRRVSGLSTEIPLTAGVSVRAEVVLEKRTLLQWLTGPLASA